MYYVVILPDRKFVRDVSDSRYAALFTTREAAERVASVLPGARVLDHVEQDNPFAGVLCFA